MRRIIDRKVASAIKSAVEVGSTLARKGLDKIDSMSKGKSVIDELEVAVAEVLMKDKKTDVILSALESKLNLNQGTLAIGAIFDEKTLMVDHYSLVCNEREVVTGADYPKLLTMLRTEVISEEEDSNFAKLVEKTFSK